MVKCSAKTICRSLNCIVDNCMYAVEMSKKKTVVNSALPGRLSDAVRRNCKQKDRARESKHTCLQHLPVVLHTL